jgi:hypothetical protein
MQVTLVQCSMRLVGEKLWKNQAFCSGINGLMRVASGCQRSHRNDENVEKMQGLVHLFRRLSIIVFAV